MHPRTELGVSAGLLLGLGLIVVAVGTRPERGAEEPRRSTYLTGPGGASAFAEAAARLGVTIERYRRPLATLIPADSGERVVVAVIGPDMPLTGADARHLLQLPTDLLLAGPGSEAAIRCLGYRVFRRPWRDSIRTRSPDGAEDLPAPQVVAVLAAHAARLEALPVFRQVSQRFIPPA